MTNNEKNKQNAVKHVNITKDRLEIFINKKVQVKKC